MRPSHSHLRALSIEFNTVSAVILAVALLAFFGHTHPAQAYNPLPSNSGGDLFTGQINPTQIQRYRAVGIYRQIMTFFAPLMFRTDFPLKQIDTPTPTWTATGFPAPSVTTTWMPTSTQKPNPTTTMTATPTLIISSTPTWIPTGTFVPSETPVWTATATQVPSLTPSHTATATQPPETDPILFFVSDLVQAGSVGRAQAVIDLIQSLMNQHPGAQMLVASGGDNEQESAPTLANYQANFGGTYATFVDQGIFMQVRGNHDNSSAGSYTDFDGTYHSSGGAYWNYFGADAHMFNIEGKKLTDYSYDMGTWHIVALDQVEGSVNQQSLNFLISDLAAHSSATCQLVYWHVPTYSSGATHGDALALKAINQAEFNAGVDIQLSGHDHDYQRFYPINPDGVRDDAHGITTFVGGIGGEDDRPGFQQSAAQAASAVYLDTFPPGTSHAIGVIMFTLHTTSADYKLYDANNGAVLDQGTVQCH